MNCFFISKPITEPTFYISLSGLAHGDRIKNTGVVIVESASENDNMSWNEDVESISTYLEPFGNVHLLKLSEAVVIYLVLSI